MESWVRDLCRTPSSVCLMFDKVSDKVTDEVSKQATSAEEFEMALPNLTQSRCGLDNPKLSCQARCMEWERVSELSSAEMFVLYC